MNYQTRREKFDKLVRKYNEYKELYRMCNNGSLEGLTTFDEFYWRLTYFDRYADTLKIGQTGH